MPSEIIISAVFLVLAGLCLGTGESNRSTRIAASMISVKGAIILALPWLGWMPAELTILLSIFWVATLPIALIIAVFGLRRKKVTFWNILGIVLSLLGEFIILWSFLRGAATAIV